MDKNNPLKIIVFFIKILLFKNKKPLIWLSEIILNLCFIICKKYFKNTGFSNNISLYFHLHDKIHTIETSVFLHGKYRITMY